MSISKCKMRLDRPISQIHNSGLDPRCLSNSLCTDAPPPLRKYQGERRLWNAVVNRVPVNTYVNYSVCFPSDSWKGVDRPTPLLLFLFTPVPPFPLFPLFFLFPFPFVLLIPPFSISPCSPCSPSPLLPCYPVPPFPLFPCSSCYPCSSCSPVSLVSSSLCSSCSLVSPVSFVLLVPLFPLLSLFSCSPCSPVPLVPLCVFFD